MSGPILLVRHGSGTPVRRHSLVLDLSLANLDCIDRTGYLKRSFATTDTCKIAALESIPHSRSPMVSSNVENTWLSNDSSKKPVANSASASDTTVNSTHHVYGVTYFCRGNPLHNFFPGDLVGVYSNVAAANRAAAKILKDEVPTWKNIPFVKISADDYGEENKTQVLAYYGSDGAVEYEVRIHAESEVMTHYIVVHKRTILSESATDDDDSDFPYVDTEEDVVFGGRLSIETAEKETSGDAL